MQERRGENAQTKNKESTRCPSARPVLSGGERSQINKTYITFSKGQTLNVYRAYCSSIRHFLSEFFNRDLKKIKEILGKP